MTRLLHRLLRLMFPAIAFAFGATAMLLFLRPAHADPLVAVTPAGIELSWQAWLMLGLAAAGGALKILDVAIAGLRWLAPRTKSTLDDHALDDLQIVRKDIAAVLQVVGGLVPAAGVPATAPDRPAGPVLVKAPGSGTAAMLAVLLLGALAAPVLTGCTAAQRTALEHAAWDCTAPARADAVAAVTPAVVSVIKAAGSADGKAIDLSTVKAAIGKASILSEAGILLSCATASAVAILTAPHPAPAPGAALSAPYELDPAAVRAVWDVLKREQLGGAGFRVAGGAVL